MPGSMDSRSSRSLGRMSPLQNRVAPDGEIIATPHRGLMMGNRGGAFHLPDQTLGPRRWATRQWIACVLEFKGRSREVMQPNRYTELFFLDEATALAAGHRPCFECRRAEAERFAELWAGSQGTAQGSAQGTAQGTARGTARRERAPAMDEALHAERVDAGRRKLVYRARRCDLPSGAFVRYARDGGDARPYLTVGNHLLAWHPSGYTSLVMPAHVGDVVEVLTPRSIVAVLSAGYRPMLHPTAAALLG
jgi:hypothetical protein